VPVPIAATPPGNPDSNGLPSGQLHHRILAEWTLPDVLIQGPVQPGRVAWSTSRQRLSEILPWRRFLIARVMTNLRCGPEEQMARRYRDCLRRVWGWRGSPVAAPLGGRSPGGSLVQRMTVSWFAAPPPFAVGSDGCVLVRAVRASIRGLGPSMLAGTQFSVS